MCPKIHEKDVEQAMGRLERKPDCRRGDRPRRRSIVDFPTA